MAANRKRLKGARLWCFSTRPRYRTQITKRTQKLLCFQCVLTPRMAEDGLKPWESSLVTKGGAYGTDDTPLPRTVRATRHPPP